MRLIPTILLGLAAAGVAPAAHAETARFLGDAMKGDNSEIRLGALAAQRGASPAVRRFGAMLERDHRAGLREVVPIARRHRVPVTSAMADEAVREHARLRHLRGAAFDREFARYMVADHRKDIAEFEKEARSGDPADLRRLAQRTLPALRRHLAAARALL